ncbi:hypothetical protein K1719_005863 [Acacia pycnantha]|nr:hypothetical protein K1719_005863 [Acacia pycnantha]
MAHHASVSAPPRRRFRPATPPSLMSPLRRIFATMFSTNPTTSRCGIASFVIVWRLVTGIMGIIEKIKEIEAEMART